MPGALIEWQGMSFHYPRGGTAVLHAVDLQIRAGEFALVAGPSGAGKSTLLRTLNGLVPHFSGGRISGRVRVCGHDPVSEGPHGMSPLVGFVQQDPEAQFVVDSVEDELAFAMENQGWTQALMRQRVEEVLRQLGITELRERPISSLSAGQKQRVAIGSALTLQPRVLVLDEPTSQLDPEAAEEVLTTLQGLQRTLGLTVVLAEHRLERVVPYADRLIFVPGEGRAAISGTPRQVLPRMSFAPPVAQLAMALGWEPLPLTVDEARSFLGRSSRDAAASEASPVRLPGRPASVEAQRVWYDYEGIDALRGVDLQLRPGELVALTGPNGSGKTTLLKHLVGLLRPSRGRVIVHGLDTGTARMEQLIQHVGYVPQDPSSLLFADSVYQELQFTRQAHGLPPADIQPWLGPLGLTALAERYPRDLSVGERQRVALAAILVAEPATLLLDEPTRGLDPLEKASLARFLQGRVSRGGAVLMATHDVELVAQCAQRLLVLDDGQIVADGHPGQVMRQLPVYSPQVHQLFGDPSLLTYQDALERQARES
jgi:energy-coupling factor transport system ATP-binding protein